MKYLILLVIFLVSNNIFSQEIFFVEDSILRLEVYTDSPDSSFYIKAHLYHNHTDTLDISWTLNAGNNSGWDYSFCDIKSCYQIYGTSSNEFKLPANDTALLKAQFKPNFHQDSSFMDLKVIIKGQHSGEKSMSYRINVIIDSTNYVSIEKVLPTKQILVSIFPNPTSSILNINIDGDEKIQKIIIYNVIGKAINTLTDISSETTINVKDYEKGLYIFKLFGEDDSIFHTQSFVKK